MEATNSRLGPDYKGSPDVLEDELLDDDEDLSDKAIRPTKRAKVITVDAIGPGSATPTQERETSQLPVSKRKLGRRKAAEKQKQMLDKAKILES